MRISDWSSDVCSSDLHDLGLAIVTVVVEPRRCNLERPAGLGAERHIGGGRFAGALRHVASGRAGGEGGQGEPGRISKHRSSPRLVMMNLFTHTWPTFSPNTAHMDRPGPQQQRSG